MENCRAKEKPNFLTIICLASSKKKKKNEYIGRNHPKIKKSNKTIKYQSSRYDRMMKICKK